ncbi:MAG TPA: aryldialkylphosphatase [Planctomycetota bacterium]|nr:aryldialkylphosphatase [Planctomycetota bacterium]
MPVRTVLGDIASAQLGRCYAHEHVIIDPSFTTHLFPDFCIDSVENACTELRDFFAAGGRAMIDCMPCDSGRNPLKLADVSRRTGVHIVAPTGIHLQRYYPPGHWSERLNEQELAQLFIDDIELGIDANDYAGPNVVRTSARAGVIKVAGGRDRLSDFEKKIFRAAALAHVKTGSPIITHTEEGTAGLEQIDILTANGVRPQSIILSHTDRQPDRNYHRSLLRRNVGLEYDSVFRWKEGQGNPTLDLVCELLPEFPDQIMLGMDAARRGYWRSYGGKPGLDALLTRTVPELLKRGVDAALIERIFVSTPASYFTFAQRQ